MLASFLLISRLLLSVNTQVLICFLPKSYGGALKRHVLCAQTEGGMDCHLKPFLLPGVDDTGGPLPSYCSGFGSQVRVWGQI